MFKEEIARHKLLFSGPALMLGKAFWYIQKADTVMNALCYIEGSDHDPLKGEDVTEFGRDIGGDSIHWWIFQKEKDIQGLLEETKKTLNSAQCLKEDAFAIKKYDFKTYSDLINKIKEFLGTHEKEITELYKYVYWLYQKDALAPSMLFTYSVWGSTRLSDRCIKVTGLQPSQEEIEKCVEVSLGLRNKFDYVIGQKYMELCEELYDSMDAEEYARATPSVPYGDLLIKTSDKVLSELATFFEYIRHSLRNIVLDISKLIEQNAWLYDDSFWKTFITKAITDDREETELWDFKESLRMWHDKTEQAKIEFCEHVAAFANRYGGVLIIGISDKHPRRVMGVTKVEEKIKDIHSTINRYIKQTDFFHVQEIVLKNETGQDTSCLIIVIKQTQKALCMQFQNGLISYPLRFGSGLDRLEPDKIDEFKKSVVEDNYYFLTKLKQFSKEI